VCVVRHSASSSGGEWRGFDLKEVTANIEFLPIDRVEIVPADGTISEPGGTLQLTAVAYSGVEPVPGVTFLWASSNMNVATVSYESETSHNATVIPGGNGSTTITATASRGGLDGHASVTVDIPVPTGDLQVNTVTEGFDLDGDGYSVTVNDEPRDIGVNDSLLFSALLAGSHSVTLGGIAENCTLVSGTLQRSIPVDVDATAETTFHLKCTAVTGAIRVTATTTGVDPDPDGYEVVLDGKTQEHLGINADEVTFSGLSPVSHEVKLTDVAANCTVTDGDARNVDVVAGESATVSFAIDCVRNAGDLTVSASTAGVDLDPDGYEVVLDDGLAQQHLDINGGAVTFSDLTAGGHIVQLTDVANNCVVAGENPRTVDVVIGEAVSTAFDVTCSAPLEPLIAFQSSRDGDTEIYTMKEDGTEVTKLTDNNALDEDPAWSPDGTKLAFQSSRDGSVDIWVLDLVTNNAVQLTDDPATDVAPDWSPDGSKIVFRSDRDGNREIYMMDAVPGATPARMTIHSARDDKPHFSPDGQRILFKSDRNGGDYDLFTMDLNGEDIQPKTNNSVSDHDPSWSPDGKMIAFGSDRSGDDEVWVMDASALVPAQRVTSSSAYDHQPDWSPDGLRLVFTREWDIWVIDVGGTNPVNLTSHGATDANPAWRR
jgi:WD40 repeat protein